MKVVKIERDKTTFFVIKTIIATINCTLDIPSNTKNDITYLNGSPTTTLSPDPIECCSSKTLAYDTALKGERS